jgi:hypothetical protein
MSLKSKLSIILAALKQKPASEHTDHAENVPEIPPSVAALTTLEPSPTATVFRPAVVTKVSHSVVRVGFSKYGGIEIREVDANNGNEILARKPHGSGRETTANFLASWRKGSR